MSLTSQLKQTRSPLRTFLESRLSNLRFLQQQWRAVGPPTIVPEAPVSWGTVGGALDYRLRYLFGLTPPERYTAATGARILGPAFETSYANLAISLSQLLASHDPRGRTLPDDAEDRLLRFCYLLALYESFYRAPITDSLLFQLGPDASTDQQLALARDSDIADLRALTTAALTPLRHLFGQPVVLNPTFAGAPDVGGADGDLIVDRLLIDIKTTKSATLDRPTIYQLIGYPLLDYNDHYRIESVGFYSSRVPHLADLVEQASDGQQNVCAPFRTSPTTPEFSQPYSRVVKRELALLPESAAGMFSMGRSEHAQNSDICRAERSPILHPR